MPDKMMTRSMIRSTAVSGPSQMAPPPMGSATKPAASRADSPADGPSVARRALRGVVLLTAVAVLAGCLPIGASKAPRLDAAGASVKGVYPVTTANVEAVRQRMTAVVNERRASAGLAPVVLDPQLVRAADAGSASMSAQNRAWLYGEDGSTPMDRARNAGFQGELIGEVVSETWESETQTIEQWLRAPEQKAILLDPNARRIGVGVHQEESMKLWWTVNVAQ